MWEYESADKIILQGISGVKVVLAKGTQSVCDRAQNLCGDSICQILPPSPPLEGLLFLLSSPALRESTKIFIFRDEKIEEVFPVGE